SRRHTRFSRDWSSDVCSSDLAVGEVAGDADRGAGAVGGDVDREDDTALGVRLAGECGPGVFGDDGEGGEAVPHAEPLAAEGFFRSEERRAGKESTAHGRRGEA